MTTATVDRVEPVQLDELTKGIRVPREDFEKWLEKHDWTFHQLARSEFPWPYRSIEEFQLGCFNSDAYLWCQAFLREPEDPDHKDPYNFFEYQIKGIRDRADKIYDCGSETGKTREIVADNHYLAFTNPNGSGLVGAPQLAHLEEIIEAMYDQFLWNPDLTSSLKKWKKAPHNVFYYTNGFRISFRPAGHDGEAFRGVHVRTFGKIDEAAKMKNIKQWSEFFRALKPHAVTALYSVTDGDRSCEFYRLKEKAKGYKNTNTLSDIPEVVGIDVVGNRVFNYHRWPKTIMPPPFWTTARKKHYIEVYGGEDKPGYKHNVLAEDGDPEYSVFPWEELKHCIKDIESYRHLKFIISRNEVQVYGYKYEVTAGDDGPINRQIILLDTIYSKAGFFDYEINPDGTMTESEFRKCIKGFFPSITGQKRGGGDFGFAGDPTELIIKSIYGKKKRLIARLSLKHVTYDQQCQAIDALDDIFGPQESITWGTDFGNAGSAVAHDLQGLPQYKHKNYIDRLKGFQFESTTDNVNRERNTIIDHKDGKPAKITLKELATDIMTKLIQEMDAEYPGDPDIAFFYPNHTVSMGGKHRIYKKVDDHVIDADRAETLAEIFATSMVEHFASGVNVR